MVGRSQATQEHRNWAQVNSVLVSVNSIQVSLKSADSQLVSSEINVWDAPTCTKVAKAELGARKMSAKRIACVIAALPERKTREGDDTRLRFVLTQARVRRARGTVRKDCRKVSVT